MSEITREGSTLTKGPLSSCSACLHEFHLKNMVRAPCYDYYCSKCILKMANDSLRDETCYPIACCEEIIPNNTFVDGLPLETRKAFEKRSKELDVPPGDRIYCPSPTCSAFVGSTDSAIDSDLESHVLVIDCKDCLTKICTRCRLAYHPGTQCNFEDDSATKALRDLALKENWKTCPGCGRIIERILNDGCYSVTCRCGTQFCYLCLDIIHMTEIKNCTCPLSPTKAHLFRDGIEKYLVDIEEMLNRSKEENVRDFIRHLSLQVELTRVIINLHVPCDIENCHEQHRIYRDFESNCTCADDNEIIIRINHEPTSNRIQPSLSQEACSQ